MRVRAWRMAGTAQQRRTAERYCRHRRFPAALRVCVRPAYTLRVCVHPAYTKCLRCRPPMAGDGAGQAAANVATMPSGGSAATGGQGAGPKPWQAKDGAAAIGVAASVLASALLSVLLSPPDFVAVKELSDTSVRWGWPAVWARAWSVSCLLAFNFAAVCLVDVIASVLPDQVDSERKKLFLDAYQALVLSIVPTCVAVFCAAVLAGFSLSVIVIACYVLVLQTCHVLHHVIKCQLSMSRADWCGFFTRYFFLFAPPLMPIKTLYETCTTCQQWVASLRKLLRRRAGCCHYRRAGCCP